MIGRFIGEATALRTDLFRFARAFPAFADGREKIMLYEISDGVLSVKISDLGAEIKSVVYRGEERAWQNENGAWAGTSPILFPVCGRTRVIVDGVDRNMTFHGFARKRAFVCKNAGKSEATFVLASCDETRAVYPFEFEFSVNYRVEKNAIIVKNEMKNTGSTALAFALGRHDSFALRNGVGGYKLCFPCEERFLSPKTDEIARLTDSFADLGGGRELPLPADYLTNGETIILGSINSDRVFLKTLDDRPVAEMDFGSVRNLLIWRAENSNMICLEPWSALPDSSDGKVNEFLSDPRFTRVGAGETKTFEFRISYYPDR